jgi:hypothetical protein
MTLFALELKVNTLEQKVFMEFPGILPAALVVTLHTVRPVGSLVHIFMASGTVFRLDLGELVVALSILWLIFIAFLGWLVAFDALHLLVFAAKLKIGFIMIKILPLGEDLRHMTGRAGAVCKLRLEHILVLVHMAFFAESSIVSFKRILIASTRWLRRQSDVRRLMALGTVLTDRSMPASKLESCHIMIELEKLGETLGAVTLSTGLSKCFWIKLLLVNRRMAVSTQLRVLFLGELEEMGRLRWLGREFGLGWYVTLYTLTLDLLVPSAQLKTCLVMIEGQTLHEVSRRMTGRAGPFLGSLAELIFMDIGMAIDAELLVGVRKLENLFPIHEVTVFTGRRLMITRQGKPGLIVKAAVRIDLPLEAHYIPAVRGMTLFTGHTFELFVKSWWVGRKMAGFAGLRC